MHDDVENEFSLDGQQEHGYDGSKTPVRLEDVKHAGSPAVVLGAIQHEGHLIRAEAMGVLVVQNAPAAEKESP